MIKLSKRLLSIASYINKNDIIMDIGCDHALLDIYISLKYKTRVYASDLRESAIRMARSNKIKYSANNVELIVANGLEKLNKFNDVNTITLSGMGCKTAIDILKDIKSKPQIYKLIIQCNGETENIRKYIIKNGFYIDDESIIFDNKKSYITTCFKRGKKLHSNFKLKYGYFKYTKEYMLYKNNELRCTLLKVPKRFLIKRINIYFEKIIINLKYKLNNL